MKKKRTIVAACAALIAVSAVLTVSSCASRTAAERSGGSFVFGLETEPSHLDPYLSNTADTREILFNVFEGLMKPDANGNLVPAVAQSYSMSADCRSYTFTIRDGIKFQNGKNVTANDVIYSIERAGGLKNGKPLVQSLTAIKSVTADKNKITISLKGPDPDFLPNLTVAIIPKGYKNEDTHPIGTGPYAFDSYTPGRNIVLKRNRYYWEKGLPHLSSVTFKFETGSSALLMDLKGGSIDGASIDNSIARQLGHDFTIKEQHSNSIQQLGLNNSVKPFDDMKVRQAISYAVDPDEIIKTVDFGKGTRVGTPVIPGLKKYFDEDLTYSYRKDDAKAKQLLTQAGYPNGFKMTITVPSNYQVHVDTAQVIVNELKAVNIKADIKQVDFATWLSSVYNGRQYEATVVSVDGPTVSPKSYLSRYVSNSPQNFENYKDAAFDSAYENAAAEPDANKRAGLYDSAQEILSKDAASVYIQDISSLVALKKGYAGYKPYPLYVVDMSSVYKK